MLASDLLVGRLGDLGHCPLEKEPVVDCWCWSFCCCCCEFSFPQVYRLVPVVAVQQEEEELQVHQDQVCCQNQHAELQSQEEPLDPLGSLHDDEHTELHDDGDGVGTKLPRKCKYQKPRVV